MVPVHILRSSSHPDSEVFHYRPRLSIVTASQEELTPEQRKEPKLRQRAANKKVRPKELLNKASPV